MHFLLLVHVITGVNSCHIDSSPSGVQTAVPERREVRPPRLLPLPERLQRPHLRTEGQRRVPTSNPLLIEKMTLPLHVFTQQTAFSCYMMFNVK